MRDCITCFLCLCFINVFPATYYVSPTGDNGNDGTASAEAWKTIQYALNTVSAGDTILIMGGTYTEKTEWNVSGTVENYITLKNYGSDIVIIDGSTTGNNTALMYIKNKNFIRIEGLKFTNHNGNYQPVINFYGSNSHFEIRNCEIYNTDCNDSYAILIEGSGDDIVIENNYLHDLEGDNAVGILFVGSDTIVPFTNIFILNNTLQNIDPAPSEAIAVNGNIDGFAIMGNNLSDINNIGIVMIGGEHWVNTNDAVNFARNGECGWNTVVHANSIYGGGYSAGIYIDGGKDITVENNTVSHSDIGIEVGCENHGFIAENNKVKNNVLYKNEKSGLGFGGYDYPTTGNVINCTFTGNTVFDNDSLDTGFGQLWIQHAENCTVSNNIFCAQQTGTIVNAYDWDITALGNKLDYNLYYSGALEAQYYYNMALINDYADYIASSAQDLHSLYAYPEFADNISYIPDLHIIYFSPAVDAGDPAFIAIGDETDMDSTVRIDNARVDIGADESGDILNISDNVSDKNLLHFYPNPAKDFCYINNLLHEPALVTIYTFTGLAVSTVSLGENDQLIPLRDIPHGIYLVKLSGRDFLAAGILEVE